MAKILKEQVKCTDRNGTQFEVQIFDNYAGGEGSRYLGESAGLPNTSAVTIIEAGVYRVVWNHEELRSVNLHGADWGKEG